MSKIKAELMAVSKLIPGRGEAEDSFLAKMVHAIGNVITDAEWASVSEPAQDWNNLAADALKNKLPLPPFPDAEAAPAATGRRRGTATPEAAAPVPYVPAKGDQVTATSKRGKVVTGFIVEITDGMVIVNAAADGPESDDVELSIDTNTFALSFGAVTTKQDEPAGPVEPEVGDTLEVETARGKIIVGNATVIEGDDLVLVDASGADHELVISKLKSVKVKVKNAGVKATEAAPATTGRTRGAAKSEITATGEAVRTRSSNETPLGGRIRDILASTTAAGKVDMPLEAMVAQLTKEGFQFRDTSVKMIYKDTCYVIQKLREGAKLK
jgi:hypothetical protein